MGTVILVSELNAFEDHIYVGGVVCYINNYLQ